MELFFRKLTKHVWLTDSIYYGLILNAKHLCEAIFKKAHMDSVILSVKCVRLGNHPTYMCESCVYGVSDVVHGLFFAGLVCGYTAGIEFIKGKVSPYTLAVVRAEAEEMIQRSELHHSVKRL